MRLKPLLILIILTFGLCIFAVFLYQVISSDIQKLITISSSSSRKGSSKNEVLIVERVIDGDTIKLTTGETIRYIGIDTPETVDPRKKVQCFGREAEQKNRELVEGKEVRLEKDVSEKDRFGRLLRYVYVKSDKGDWIFVNRYLVSEGYAYASSYPPDIKYQDVLNQDQKDAIFKKKGLWTRCPSS